MADKPDLVILDLGLPDMQGHELLRQIRARREDLPIVVLSSRGDEIAKVEALDLGADDYVTKPFGMEEWSGNRWAENKGRRLQEETRPGEVARDVDEPLRNHRND